MSAWLWSLAVLWAAALDARDEWRAARRASR